MKNCRCVQASLSCLFNLNAIFFSWFYFIFCIQSLFCFKVKNKLNGEISQDSKRTWKSNKGQRLKQVTMDFKQ